MSETRENILTAAIDLIAKKGYQATRTKEIAETAGVSEMTLFRHFASKKLIFEEGMDRYSFDLSLKNLFQENLVCDLQSDLHFISKTFVTHLKKNQKLFSVLLREAEQMPDLKETLIYKNPVQMKKMLVSYFEQMQAKGKMIQTDPEVQAITLITLNLRTVIGIGEMLPDISHHAFIQESIQTLVRGLTP